MTESLFEVSKPSVLPYAPDVDRWTDDHFELFSLFELASGNRKELTKEEKHEMATAQLAEELLESGDPDWLKKVESFLEEGGDFESLDIDIDTLADIDKEQRIRGE